MTDHRIKIVVTDGENTRTISRIGCGRDYVFASRDKVNGEPTQKITYHSDGYVHYKRYPGSPVSTKPMCYGPPLDEFGGFFAGNFHMSVGSNVSRLVAPDFHEDDKKADHVTYVDVRDIELSLPYHRFICEPGFPLGDIIKKIQKKSQSIVDCDVKISYHVYTAVEPWVGVIYGPGLVQHTVPAYFGEFRPMGSAVEAKENESPYHTPCPNDSYGCDGPSGKGPLCRKCLDIIQNR